MTINTGVVSQDTKKMIFWGYLSNLINLISGFIVLPMILKYLSLEDLASYYYIVSVVAFMTILDIGYGPQLSKNITYILNGARRLSKKGIDNNVYETIDTNLLQATIKTSFLFYKVLCLLSMIVSAMVLANHFNWSIDHDTIIIIIVFSFSMLLNTLTSFISPVLNGAGFIIESRIVNVINKVFATAIFIFLLYFGFGVFSYIISLFISSLTVLVLGGYYYYYCFYKKYLLGLNVRVSYSFELFGVIFDNAKNIGIYYLSINLISRSIIIFGEGYLKDSLIAAYGFLLQIFSIISNFSTVTSSILQTKLTSSIVKRNGQEILRNFGLGVFSFLVISSLVSVFTIFTLDIVVIFIGSEMILPENYILMVFSIFVIVDMHHQLFNSFLSSKNEFPFVTTTFFSAVITSILMIILIKFRLMDTTCLMFVPFLVQSVFNYWYWPRYVCRNEKINYTKLFRITNLKEINQ
ncbi:hypothetical protein MOU95_003491 [Vibrio vulnificus]|nr:hypothetical protein [Vibrio vulnificus]